MDALPKVSIITACYNSEKSIASCITSCLNQSYPNIEHIFVDGGSTDKTQDVILGLIPKAYLVSQKDSGIYDAFNKGIRRSTGEFIFFLNSDDAFFNNQVVDKAVNIMLENDADCLFASVEIRLNYFNFVRSYKPKYPSVRNLENGMMPPHTGSFIRKKVYEKIGNFKEDFLICGDYEWFCRLALDGGFSSVLADNIVAVKMASGGASSRNLGARINLHSEIYKSLSQNGLKANHLRLFARYLRKIFEFKLS